MNEVPSAGFRRGKRSAARGARARRPGPGRGRRGPPSGPRPSKRRQRDEVGVVDEEDLRRAPAGWPASSRSSVGGRRAVQVRRTPADRGRLLGQHQPGDLDPAAGDGHPAGQGEQQRAGVRAVDHRDLAGAYGQRDRRAPPIGRSSAYTACVSPGAGQSARASWWVSASPSTSKDGSRRSIQRGSHQAARPSRASTAGTRVIRTTKASMNTPTARPNAMVLIGPSPSGHEGGEDREHDHRRRHDDARGGGEAVLDGPVGVAAVHVLLADPGDQEHLVVHGQAEQDAHQQDGQEADHRRGLARR